MRAFLAYNSIITLLHPPYSPHLAPCDFFLFPKMKLKLKGRRFDRVEKIQRESQNVLGTLREQNFQQRQWRWDGCVAVQGDYFEGDAAPT
jgi:hypothetical protein